MKILQDLKEKAAMRRLAGAVLMAAVFGCATGNAYAAEATEATEVAETADASKENIDEYSVSDVVVTAERIPTERMNTPANISVITSKDIEANHYADVAEALSQVNGVTISNQGSFDCITLNGDERVVVMIDGRRLNNDQGFAVGKQGVDLKMIPTLKNIDRIEVVKGGASALYGSDAAGGVVNIITKRGSKKPETTLDVNMGSWGTYNYEIATQGSDHDFSWFVSGGIQKQNHARYKMYGETHEAPTSEKDDNSFMLRLDQNLDKSSSVRLNFEHKTKHDGTYFNTINYSDPGSDHKREENFNNAAISYHFKEDKKTPGFVRLFNNYRGTYQGEGKFNTKLYGLDYQNGWELGEHTLITGVEWHESRSTNDSNGYLNEGIRNIAAYVQDTWKLGEKWSLVPGVRLDHHNLYGNHWSPKIALNYRAHKNTQIYASWGRVFHAPTADDLYWNQPSWKLKGNPDLKPESGHTETIGINHSFDNDTSLGFSVFQSRIHDAITWMPDSGWTVATNVQREKRRGLELSFNRRISPVWDLDIGYSYTRIEQSNKKTGEMFYYAKNRNPNSYHFGLKYHQGAWKAGLYGKITTGLDTNKYMLTRHMALIDLNVSYDVNKATTIYFKALNLTNQEYSTYTSDYGGYYPGNGRFFQLGVTYTF